MGEALLSWGVACPVRHRVWPRTPGNRRWEPPAARSVSLWGETFSLRRSGGLSAQHLLRGAPGAQVGLVQPRMPPPSSCPCLQGSREAALPTPALCLGQQQSLHSPPAPLRPHHCSQERLFSGTGPPTAGQAGLLHPLRPEGKLPPPLDSGFCEALAAFRFGKRCARLQVSSFPCGPCGATPHFLHFYAFLEGEEKHSGNFLLCLQAHTFLLRASQSIYIKG